MFGRNNKNLWYAAIALVVGYFVKDKLPESVQGFYAKMEEKLKK